ncbi:MAG: glycosyltransferase family 39 protein [Pyrinomonadaceae bacterium]
MTAGCLWFDEIFSVHAAEHGWVSLFDFVAQNLIHPPLFYILLKFWISAGGETLFWLRLFPLLFSVIALIPFYLLCRQLKLNYQTIALALTFFAVNGALIKYAQEVRMYSLLLCLSLFSMWLFSRYFNFGKNYKILILINFFLVYTHYFGWFIVLSEVLIIGVFQNIKIRQILIMFGILILSYTPWIFAVWNANLTKDALMQNVGWMSRPDTGVILQFVFDVIEPFYYQQSSSEPATKFFITFPILLIIAAAKVFYLSNWKNESEKITFYLLSMFIAVPLALTLILSWLLPFSIWETSHLIIVFIPALILSAKFLTELNILWLKRFLLSVIFLFMGLAFLIQIKTGKPKFIWCGWENPAQNIDTNQPQKIYVFEDLTAYHFWFALRGRENRVEIIKVNNMPGIEENKAYFLPRGFDSVKTIDANSIAGDKFWIAFSARNFDESKPPLNFLLEKGYKIGEPKIFDAQDTKGFLVPVEK